MRKGSSDERISDGRFELFDITVYLGPGFIPWISAVSRLGHVHGIPRRDPTLPPIDELLDGVYDFVDAVRFAEREPNPMLATALGQMIFGEPSVLELFQATRGAAADRGDELLVRILASPHLAVLPWELLPDPAKGEERRYLALAPDATVVRLARGRTYPVRRDPIDPPLNLLVVLSSPMGRDPADDSLAFDIYEEKRSLLAELAPLVDAGLINVDVEDQPTVENLRRQIGRRRRGYHLFHYLGHAEPDRLILEDEHGRRDDQRADQFTQILRLCPELRLAVFAGCETARAPWDPVATDTPGSDGWRSIFSMADRCVQDSCPMVVGMQAVLPFRTERLFTRFFYQGIVSGYPVASAIRLARGATRGDRHVGGDLLDWSVPVLFVGGSDPGPLLQRSAVGQKPEKTPRHFLRLGLRQRETQFFARDVALRQAIDVLSGDATERVLVVTGPSKVGKTFLIDRALEEVQGPLSVLYVKFEDLVPGVDSETLDKTPGAIAEMVSKLRAVAPDAVLGRLCTLVSELLSRGDGRRRVPETNWRAEEWWPWLVEDLTTIRFVLVIDNLDLLMAMEQAVVQQLVPFWLGPQVSNLAKTAASGDRELSDHLDDFIERLRDSSSQANGTGTSGNPLYDRLPEFRTLLQVTSLNRAAETALIEAAQGVLDALQGDQADAADVVASIQSKVGPDERRERLLADLTWLRQLCRVLDRALRAVAERRSACRIAAVASQMPQNLLNLPPEWRFEMRLGHLTWGEAWRWIHRNLPGLVRYGDTYLCRLWSRLGPDLSRWEELERRVLTATSEPDLTRAANEIAASFRARPDGPVNLKLRPRGERPLRVAVAGPHLAGPEELALAFTTLAAQHQVGGRVVPGIIDAASLAVVSEEPSPFHDGMATESEILQWIDRVSEEQADIILLDYGAPVLPGMEGGAARDFLRALRHRTLLIAAGGNVSPNDPKDVMFTPAAYREVLAVGPLDAEGRLQSYAAWKPSVKKPDVFMADNLLDTPLAEALRPEQVNQGQSALGPGTHGSSFSALHAVAAAVMVWSTLPYLSPRGVRRLLMAAARPVAGAKPAKDGKRAAPAPLGLTLADALSHARQKLVKDTLAAGPCSQQALAAITGLDMRVVRDTIDNLIVADPPEVRLLSRSRLERYELLAPR